MRLFYIMSDSRPTLKEQLECAKELLDRCTGRPTQVAVETGDDTSRQVPATTQRILKRQQAKEQEQPNKPLIENVSPIDAIRDKSRE